MSGPPAPHNYDGVDNAGKSPSVPPHTRSAPPTTTVYSGAFFSGAHHFDIQGGEFSSAQTMHKTIHNDNSYRSNFNNTRNDDFRGSAHYVNTYQGAYTDSRQIRSQKYDARYNDLAPYSSGRGRGRGQYNRYVEDDYYDDDGDSYSSSYNRGPTYNRGRYGPSPSYSRWRDDDNEPRMIESRESIRQRDRDRNQGLTFDDLYSPNQFFPPRNANRSNSGRELDPEPISSMVPDRAGVSYQQEPKSYAYDKERDEGRDEEYQQQRRPKYGPGPSSGSGPGPSPGWGSGSGSGFDAPTRPAESRNNPFRASTLPVPNPVTRTVSNPGPGTGARPNPRTPWTPPRGTGRGPQRGVTIEEVEDVEMRSPIGEAEGEGEGEDDENEEREPPSREERRFTPRGEHPSRSYTTGL